MLKLIIYFTPLSTAEDVENLQTELFNAGLFVDEHRQK